MEVNVGDDRNFWHALANFFEANRRVVVRHREPHNLATSANHLFDLRDRCAAVGSISLGHRLDDAWRAGVEYRNWQEVHDSQIQTQKPKRAKNSSPSHTNGRCRSDAINSNRT